MKKMQSGFTLIELIAVIVILGILAATAVPRFISLQDDASFAAMQGVAGAIASASDLNVAAARTRDAGVSAGSTTIVDTSAGCVPATVNGDASNPGLLREAVSKLVTTNTSANGEYVITGGAFPATASTGDTLLCTLTLDDSTTAITTFTLSFAN
ncbi:type II secretion system protein [Simiduia agarivorans]|uniref:MSHA pilin protein MshA n=1 Tax=Simiduia agarivorans (strain DSM 21679 / JCM 13881 / BCRC 17597 / SA1) TaxID=1117647 RepID=K4KVT4_SIMAS|nr:type II secretion system protein [Simiduia agarivorans]AFU98052.1 hypothetical protein M5M_04225 [Simiduia agarivorans SA1 = DSM 21679]